ncbi:MAG: hypothetical protein K8I60_00515 [Anaerolineae bacterium]|nr:hypothetical protein [Anaerolineae bacterium]
MPRSRAAPLRDPAGVAQRVGMIYHADRTHLACVRPGLKSFSPEVPDKIVSATVRYCA